MPAVELYEQGSARIQLMQHPPGLPGKCAICGYAGGEDRQFIDFGMEVDFYGGIYICTSCTVTMAEVLGYVTPEKYDTLVDNHQLAITELNRLEQLNDNLRASIHSLTGGESSSSPTINIEATGEPVRERDITSTESSDLLDKLTVSEGTNDNGDSPGNAELVL